MATKSKNQKKNVELFLTIVTSCMVVATIWVILAGSQIALAKKPGSGGPGGETQDIPVCVTVANTDAIASDGDPLYCHSKKKHVGAIIGKK